MLSVNALIFIISDCICYYKEIIDNIRGGGGDRTRPTPFSIIT